MTTTEHPWNESASNHANIIELLDTQSDKYGTETLCTFPQGERTYASLVKRSRELAIGLDSVGIEAGDRIAIMMYNHPSFLDLYFAGARLGAIIVPINVSLRGEDLSYTLRDADPSLIILGSDCIDRYDEIRDELTISTEFVVDAANAEDDYEALVEYYTKGSVPTTDVGQADPLAIIYTSGTTGMPKGVVLSHGTLLTVGTELSERVIKPTDDDLLYMSQPLFHIFPQMVMMEAIVAGIPFAMAKWFSKSKFWSRVCKHDATIIHFSSAISDILYEATESDDNPVRIAFGAIDDGIQSSFGEKFNCQVIPLYGLTECGGLALCGTIDKPLVGSIGIPTSYVNVEIVDGSDAPVSEGEHGEIVIRPTKPNAIFSRYYNKPERTVETLENQWLHTGDIGYHAKDGRFHFVNRQSHFLRRKGENVSVYEVERILDDYPAIDKSVVVGVDADVGGEEILAVLKPAPGTEIDPLEVIKFCEGRMAYFKIPRYVATVEEFPRTETKGTIERHEITNHTKGKYWDINENSYELER